MRKLIKTKSPDILITVQNGCVEVLKKPKGLRIEIRDYDIQEENEYTKTDKEGDLYERLIV